MKFRKSFLGMVLTVAAILMFNSCSIVIDVWTHSDITFNNDLVSIDRWGDEYDTIAKNIDLRDASTYNVIQYYNSKKVKTGQSVVFEHVEDDKKYYFTFELFYDDYWFNITTRAFRLTSDYEFSLYKCIKYNEYDTYNVGNFPRIALKVGDQIIECTATPIEK